MAKDKATAASRIPLIQASYILDEFGSQVETQPPDWGSKGKGEDPHPIEFICSSATRTCGGSLRPTSLPRSSGIRFPGSPWLR